MTLENSTYILSYIIPFLILYLAYRKTSMKKEFSIVENAVIIQFLLWKGSYAIFSFDQFMQQPISLLYFTGGISGLVLSLIVAIVYIAMACRKKDIRFTIAFLQSMQFIGFSLMVTTLMKENLIVSVGLFIISSLVMLYIRNNSLKLQSIILLLLSSLLIFAVGTFIAEKNTHNVSRSLYDIVDGNEKIIGDVDVFSLQGKKVVVNFFATWCPPCKAELPELKVFYSDILGKDDVVFLAVNVTTTEKSLDDVKTFLEKENIPFPVLLDESGYWTDSLKVISYPTTIVIDGKGKVVKSHQGPVSSSTLHSYIK